MSLKVFFTFLIDYKCLAFGISNNDKSTSEIRFAAFLLARSATTRRIYLTQC